MFSTASCGLSWLWHSCSLVLLSVQTGSRAHPSSCSGGTRFLSPEVKQLEHAVNHSPQSNGRVKNEWGIFSIPPLCLHGMGRENLTFYCFICTYFYFHAMNYLQQLFAAGSLKILLITLSTGVVFYDLIYFNDCLRSLIDILAEQGYKVYYWTVLSVAKIV